MSSPWDNGSVRANVCESPGWRISDGAPILRPGAIHLWRFPLGPPPRHRLDEFLGWLSRDEQQRMERLLIPATAQRFIIARAGLRGILARYLGVSPASLVFAYGRHGKPGLATPTTTLEFNLSHCRDLALLAVTAGQPLGLDLEQVRQKLNLLGIAKRMFSPDEYRQLRELQDERQRQAFFRAWTAVEAQAKARGCGVFAGAGEPADPPWQLRHLVPAPGYLAAVAAQRLPPDHRAWCHLEPAWENPA